MQITARAEADDKVIAVPVDDPRFNNVNDLSDVNSHTIKEIEHFFLTYKKIQNKEVTVSGFKGKKEAQAAFERGRKLYNEKK
jgi:inorganic pyrophosphatase